MKKFHSFMIMACAMGLAACNGESSTGTGARLGTDQVVGTPAPVPTDAVTDPTPAPTSTTTPPSTTPSTAAIGPTCHSNDPNQICLSLKYVVYANSSGTPVVSQEQALANLAEINSLWAQCNIAFEFGEFVASNPADKGLAFNTSSSGEFSSIRRAYGDDKTMLVVTTGTWSGSLGAGSANAWTTMPGGGDYGVILEAPVGDYPNIIAHELGHYLNLDHASATSNVMSAVIYSSSTGLTSGQCATARATAASYWSSMYR